MPPTTRRPPGASLAVPAQTQLQGTGTHRPFDPGRKGPDPQTHRKLVGWAAGALGAGGAARAFTEELAANIPIGPVDAKMIAVARGVQVAGILLCVMDGRELAKCECFRDLALYYSRGFSGRVAALQGSA